MRRCLILAAVAMATTACGKKGPLIYPDMLVPAAPTGGNAEQSGNSIRVGFNLPDKDRAGRKLLDLAGVKIARRETEAGGEQLCRACTSDYRLFRKLYTDVAEGYQVYGNRIVLLDGDVQPGRAYSYRFTPFTKGGIDGQASLPVDVTAVKSHPAPVLKADFAPTEIVLNMAIMSDQADGTLTGFNIYRFTKEGVLPLLPINKVPVTGSSYVDTAVSRGVTYRYVVRGVIRMPDGTVLESAISNEVAGMLVDGE